MILLFHDVGYYKHPYCITPEELERYLDLYPDAEIHFDDGRKGVYNYAAKILKEKGRTATLFLVPAFILGYIPPSEHYSHFMSEEDVKELISILKPKRE